MKKKLLIIIPIMLIIIGVVSAFYIKGLYKDFDFKGAESVTISDLDGKKSVKLTGEEKEYVENFCSSKRAYSEKIEIPACFFDTVKITIKKNHIKYVIYPSNDSCRNLCIETPTGTYYHEMRGDLDKLTSLLERHGIEWFW